MSQSPISICSLALAAGLWGTAQAADFETCKGTWQEQAREAGLSPRIIDQVIPALQAQPRVLELDRKQPEFTSSFGSYIGRRLTDSRIDKGKILLEEHAELLRELTRRYGIPGRMLVAFWGLETNYGGYLGNTPTLDALATLGCDPRRSRYFSAELITALGLIEEHDLEPARMRGSWAGAMGQTQFMPSNYRRYGIDGDNDGQVDLWNSVPDALHSAANFLHQLGWEAGLRWGREVRLPPGFDYRMAGLKQMRPLQEWADLGLRHGHGGPLPVADIDAALLVPAGHQGPAFLVYGNFRIIMRWNNSEFYALSVGLLADRLIGAMPLAAPLTEDQRTIRLDKIKALQTRLNALGVDAGPADGILGPGTREAISAFQAANDMIADGYHSSAVFSALGIDLEAAQ